MGEINVSNYPRFLFRVWSSKSNGENSISEFTSVATSNGRGTDALSILDMPRHNAQALLASHIRWTVPTGSESTLISFTNSLLWALHFALHEVSYHGSSSTSSRLSSFADIHLCVVDTASCSPTTFVSRADIVRHFSFTQNDDALLRSDFNDSEYFAEDYIDVSSASSSVTLQELLEAGLFDLFPELGQDKFWHQLHHRVEALRRTFANPVQASPEKLQIARKLADCFDRPFRRFMWLWFLSLRTYNFFVEHLEQEAVLFDDPFSSQDIQTTTHLIPATVPELARFVQLANRLSPNRPKQGRQMHADDLSRTLEDVHIKEDRSDEKASCGTPDNHQPSARPIAEDSKSRQASFLATFSQGDQDSLYDEAMNGGSTLFDQKQDDSIAGSEAKPYNSGSAEDVQARAKSSTPADDSEGVRIGSSQDDFPKAAGSNRGFRAHVVAESKISDVHAAGFETAQATDSFDDYQPSSQSLSSQEKRDFSQALDDAEKAFSAVPPAPSAPHQPRGTWTRGEDSAEGVDGTSHLEPLVEALGAKLLTTLQAGLGRVIQDAVDRAVETKISPYVVNHVRAAQICARLEETASALRTAQHSIQLALQQLRSAQ